MSSSSRSSSRTTTQPGSPRPGGGGGRALPWVYARASVHKLTTRYNDDALRAATARYGAHYLPDVPVTALIAAGVTSTGPTEHGGPPDYATGYYGVEWQWWQTVAADAETRAVLGRPGPTTYDGFDRDIEAQAFAGMRTYRRHLDLVAAQLARHGSPLATGDAPWRYRLAVSGYSAGPATVAGTILGALPSAAGPGTGATWRELAAAVDHLCPSCAAHVGPIACCGRWHAADVVVRCDGRFESGVLLAAAVAREDLPWYAGALDTQAERDVLSRLTSRVNSAA